MAGVKSFLLKSAVMFPPYKLVSVPPLTRGPE